MHDHIPHHVPFENLVAHQKTFTDRYTTAVCVHTLYIALYPPGQLYRVHSIHDRVYFSLDLAKTAFLLEERLRKTAFAWGTAQQRPGKRALRSKRRSCSSGDGMLRTWARSLAQVAGHTSPGSGVTRGKSASNLYSNFLRGGGPPNTQSEVGARLQNLRGWLECRDRSILNLNIYSVYSSIHSCV
jgi:hypothetical protein